MLLEIVHRYHHPHVIAVGPDLLHVVEGQDLGLEVTAGQDPRHHIRVESDLREVLLLAEAAEVAPDDEADLVVAHLIV